MCSAQKEAVSWRIRGYVSGEGMSLCVCVYVCVYVRESEIEGGPISECDPFRFGGGGVGRI